MCCSLVGIFANCLLGTVLSFAFALAPLRHCVFAFSLCASVFALACLFAIPCSRYYIYLNKSKIAYCEMRSNKMVKWNAKFSCVFEYTFISII